MTINGSQFHAGKLIAVHTQISGDSVHTNFLQTAGAKVDTIATPNAVVGISEVSGDTRLEDGNLDTQAIEASGDVKAGSVLASKIYAIKNLSRCGGDVSAGLGCPTLKDDRGHPKWE